jgi:hypothetical protein
LEPNAHSRRKTAKKPPFSREKEINIKQMRWSNGAEYIQSEKASIPSEAKPTMHQEEKEQEQAA